MQELGGSTARQIAKLVNGNVPYHRCHAQFRNGGWPGGGIIFYSLFCEFKSSLVWEFDLFLEFSVFWEFCEIHDIWEFWVPQSLLGD